MENVTFGLKNLEEFKRSLTRMQSFEEELIAAAPHKDPQDIAASIYENLSSKVPHHIWSEVSSELNQKCGNLVERDDFSALIGLSLAKIRQIITRESFQNRFSKSVGDKVKFVEGEKPKYFEKKKNVKVEERSRQVRFEDEIESDDEAASCRFQSEVSDEEEDEAQSCKFGDRQGGKYQGEKKPFVLKLLAPIGYYFDVEKSTKEKIIDFDVLKSKPCFFCRSSDHGVSDCPLSFGDRVKIMEKRITCSKCLVDGHMSFECDKPRKFFPVCQICQKRGHWEVLCWGSLTRKAEEERKKRKGGEAAQESKVKQLKSESIVENFDAETSRKYRGRDGES
jgi:hypothetical protein